MERLPGIEYYQGITRGMQIIIDECMFAINDYTSRGKRLKKDKLQRILTLILEHRHEFTNFDDCFIRYKPKEDDFEFWRVAWNKKKGGENNGKNV